MRTLSNILSAIDAQALFLSTIGQAKTAAWLCEKREELVACKESAASQTGILQEIRNRCGGMGGFTDIPLPKELSGEVWRAMRERQLQHADVLFKAVSEALDA